jgi:hypothetical protein
MFVQVTGTPQLLVAGPQARLAHGLPVGVQPQALEPAFPPPHVLGGVHVFGQLILCPQLFVAGPHASPLQALVLLGVQQLRLDWHTPAFGHAAEHATAWPQLLVTVVLHFPAHAVALSGVQQSLVLQTSVAEAQLTVPLAPHDTVWPQLFVAAPHDLPAHVVDTGSGTQPHDPFVQVSPWAHPGHTMVCPQLSVTGPHRFVHHVEGDIGAQHDWLDVHTPPSAHVEGHATDCPQLFVTAAPQFPEHASALSGMQHVPPGWHTSPPAAHEGVPFAPQATTWPQLLVAMPQFFPMHVVVAGSGSHPQLPAVHGTPPSQPGQLTGAPQLS